MTFIHVSRKLVLVKNGIWWWLVVGADRGYKLRMCAFAFCSLINGLDNVLTCFCLTQDTCDS